MNVFEVNIERGILNQILYDNSSFQNIKSLLTPEDFGVNEHRAIFRIMFNLAKNDLPIADSFIIKEINGDVNLENAFLDILTVNPIVNYEAYCIELKEVSLKRALTRVILSSQAEINNNTTAEVIETLQKKLSDLKDTKINSSDLNFLRNKKINAEDLNREVEHLIKGLLVKNTLNMWFASGGKGKSLLALSLSIKLLKENLINEVFYLDMDNSVIALKNRNLEKLINQISNLRYIHKIKIDSPKKLLKDMSASALSNKELFQNKLIIIDSIRDFLSGSDINHDTQVQPILEYLKHIREAGATIVFLHHISKSGVENKQSKGATAFRDSVDCSYYIDSNKISENMRSYTLTNDKDRIGFAENLAFEMDVKNLTLNLGNYEIATMDKREMEFVNKVKDILSENNGIKQTELLRMLDKLHDKTTIELLKKYTDIFWITHIGDKNAKMYFLIKEKKIDINGVETIYS